jgi:hypothetical protein
MRARLNPLDFQRLTRRVLPWAVSRCLALRRLDTWMPFIWPRHDNDRLHGEPFWKHMDGSQCRYFGGETITILRYLCISLCLLGGASVRAQVAPPSGAWRQTNVTRKNPPAELELTQRYSEARILYFSPDQRFVLLAGTVIQGPTSEAISGGDGRVVYLGTWKLTGNSLQVEYRLVSRTVAEGGETLPGPVHSEGVRVKRSLQTG